MAITQLSVFLTNQPGQLENALDKIAGTGASIHAMSIAEASAFGILRLIVSKPSEVRQALLDDQFLVSSNHMVAVKTDAQATALKGILSILNKAGLNIEYMYSFTGSETFPSYVVLRFDDYKAAEAVLKESGIELLTDEEIIDR